MKRRLLGAVLMAVGLIGGPVALACLFAGHPADRTMFPRVLAGLVLTGILCTLVGFALWATPPRGR